MAARKSKSERLQDLDQKLSELLARKRAIESEQTAVERKALNHRKAILGGWLMANDPAAVERIKGQLRRPQDRSAFGLAPLDALRDTPAQDSPQQEQFA